MGAIVTPVDVAPEVGTEADPAASMDATCQPPGTDITVSKDVPPPADLPVPPATPTPETLQRLEQRLETWVPNLTTRAALRAIAQVATTANGLVPPHAEVFTVEQLPFRQLQFIASFHAPYWFWGFHRSIMFPYHAAMVSIISSTGIAFMAMTTNHGKDAVTEYPNIGLLAVIGPLALALFVLLLLHEHPCRMLLYHRLWEHKLVVNFKSRSLGHPVTQFKLGFLALVVIFYCWYGRAEYDANYKFYLVLAQSFGTVAWVIYSNQFIDSSLIPVNGALRHFMDVDKKKREVMTEEETAKAMAGSHPIESAAKKYADVMAQATFVAESDVKYDIVAVMRYMDAAKKQRREAASDPGQLMLAQQDLEWLASLSTWIGRLGHSKATVPGDVSRVQNELYAYNFVSNGGYKDALWHACGSFANGVNSVGPSGWIDKSLVLSMCSIVVVEVCVLQWGET